MDNNINFLKPSIGDPILHHFHDVKFSGINLNYPNILLSYNDKLLLPINDLCLSLNKKSIYKELKDFNLAHFNVKLNIDYPVYFFGYNLNNYFHFIFDALPHLYFFKKSKAKKILLFSKDPPRYFWEALNLLGLNQDDVIYHDQCNSYSDVFVCSPMSYGCDFDDPPPHQEFIYNFYDSFIDHCDDSTQLRSIYISRRSWVHNQYNNIGTDYTSKRKLVNENDVVSLLKSLGYVEVFTELLTINEVICMFRSAKNICSPLGGGLTNLIFGSENLRNLNIIHHPTKYQGNPRFKYCFRNCSLNDIDCSSFVDKNIPTRYTRVSYNGILGEVTNNDGFNLKVSLQASKNFSFNDGAHGKKIVGKISDFEILDKGVNSPWEVNLSKLEKKMK